MSGERLTDETYWDEFWQRYARNLPVEVSRDTPSLQARAILEVFDAWVSPADPGLEVLEVGGAPGQYLAYVHRLTGCRCSVLDFSPVGCAATRENFHLLGIPVTVYERDIFDAGLDIGPFDVVYSLGLIEHFGDVAAAAQAHARLVAPGGLLILGVPNLLGVNGWFAKRLDYARFASHNLGAMRLEQWDAFEQASGLRRLFRGYVGGFEPGVFARYAPVTGLSQLLVQVVARALVRTVGRHFVVLRRFNHPAISGYLMGVWRVGHGYQ